MLTAPDDYVSIMQQLTFAPGTTNLTVAVQLILDNAPESLERFFVALSSPSGDAALGSNAMAIIFITGKKVIKAKTCPI